MTAPAVAAAGTAPGPVGAARSRRRRAATLAAALLATVLLSLAVGAHTTSPADVLDALLRPATAPQDVLVVVRDLRVPRTLVGLLAGAAFGIAGVVMQGVTRNPVADPGLLGVNAGASLAVVAAIALLGASGTTALVGAALLGAAAAAALVAAVAVTARAGASPAVLVVTGAAVTAGLTSVTSLVLLSDPVTLDRFRFWTVGSPAGRDADVALALLPVLVAAALGALALSRALDALALGDDVAAGLGFRLTATRVTAVAVVVVLSGAATALAGPLVFVGLLAAHAARAVTTRHLRLLPVAAVAGACLVVAADVVGRLVAPPGELEAGLVLAALGAPALVALARSGRTGAL